MNFRLDRKSPPHITQFVSKFSSQNCAEHSAQPQRIQSDIKRKFQSQVAQKMNENLASDSSRPIEIQMKAFAFFFRIILHK
jgi:hypothetical protein